MYNVFRPVSCSADPVLLFRGACFSWIPQNTGRKFLQGNSRYHGCGGDRRHRMVHGKPLNPEKRQASLRADGAAKENFCALTFSGMIFFSILHGFFRGFCGTLCLVFALSDMNITREECL